MSYCLYGVKAGADSRRAQDDILERSGNGLGGRRGHGGHFLHPEGSGISLGTESFSLEEGGVVDQSAAVLACPKKNTPPSTLTLVWTRLLEPRGARQVMRPETGHN